MWPFSKKNSKDAQDTDVDARLEGDLFGDAAEAPDTEQSQSTPVEPSQALADAVVDGSAPSGEAPAVPQVSDSAAGTPLSGPFDGGQYSISDFDFSDFSSATLDLGSIQLPLPKQSQVQVEMGPRGPKMLHVLTEQGRITPVAFAAPSSGGQWTKALADIRANMEKDGIKVHTEPGPWGEELVGQASENGNVIRIIGVDGPRWMLRVTLATHYDKADAIAQIGRDVIARTIVHRGDAAILAGDSLPVRLPKPLAEQVVAEMKRRNQMQQAAHNKTPDAGK